MPTKLKPIVKGLVLTLFLISYGGNGKFSWRASIEMLGVAHLGSNTHTTRNSQTAAKRERVVAAQECVWKRYVTTSVLYCPTW